MIVADAVKCLEDALDLGRHWFRTPDRMIRTIDLIHELKKVDQNLSVLTFETNKRGIVPEIYILIDGREINDRI